MIGLIKRRTRGQKPRVEVRLSWGRQWLLCVGILVSATALAADPPPPPPPASAAAPDAPDAPGDEFIEFLGADDVGDAAWWEFLKKAPPRGVTPPAPPPQDTRQ
jgi:hypothetical protein